MTAAFPPPRARSHPATVVAWILLVTVVFGAISVIAGIGSSVDLAELVAGSAAALVAALLLVRGHHRPQTTDGAAYAIMGAGVWACLLLGLAAALLAPSSRRTYRAVRAGWYADPSHRARLRWWDGHAWSDTVGP
jgi:hypothetical protein